MTPKIFQRRASVFVPVLLAGVILATFGWGLHTPTLIAHESSILHLPLLAWWKNLPLIFSRHFLMFSEGQFRPLSYGLLAVVRTFIGAENVLFWHIWLLAFHWLNAILVFLLVRYFSKHLLSAVLAAVLFSLHPLASVVVNNINHFHYVLGLTFYLGVLCSYLSFAHTSRRRSYVAAVVLFLLGLFTSKVVFTLPIVLGAYEVLYRRSGFRTVLARLLPFTAFPLLLSPLWLFYKPHPLYYKYIDFPPRAGWYSFFSVVGATGWYAKGLLFGWNIPVVLHEVVERILNFPHWRFLIWGLINLGVLMAGGWALRGKRWAGLGILFLFGAMIPFASTAWNRVDEYISWTYLYAPSVGLALLLGGLADQLWSSARRGLRTGVLTFLCLLVLYYGVQQARINVTSRSAVDYWGRVLRFNPSSEIASVELGKAYLKLGKEAQAFRFLFSPVTKQIQGSCLVMSRYYCAQGDYLAAAIHLGMTGQQETGLQFQDPKMARAELFYAAGALDYAESALGGILMRNPYNITAMEQLAEIWLLRGYIAATGRLTERTLEIAPSHRKTVQMRRMLEAQRSAAITSRTPQVVHPPTPGWLRYATGGPREAQLRQAIVRSSERYHSDPLIQMEAGICLVKSGQPGRALSKLEFATESLSSYAYAWAMKCWAATEAGAYEQADEAGERAQELDPRSPTVHSVLGILFSAQAGDPRDPAYQRKLDRAIQHYQHALQLEPGYASAHNNLGNALRRASQLDEAIEHYRQALRIKSDYAEAYNNLGIALAQQNRLQEAVDHFQQALRIRPDYAEAHNNLGIALAQQDRLQEAVDHFQEALRIRPDYAEARDNLRMALRRQRGSGESR